MELELELEIYKINETQKITETFQKREFIGKIESQYPQYISMQVTKDKCNVLDNYNVGDKVKVNLNLNGRLWTNKEGVEVAFNALECWRIEKLAEATTVEVTNEPKEFPIASNDAKEEFSDLPF